MESYFSASATTIAGPRQPVPTRPERGKGAALGAPYGNQGVPIATADTHHDGSPSETNNPEDALFSIALPFDSSADPDRAVEGTAGRK